MWTTCCALYGIKCWDRSIITAPQCSFLRKLEDRWHPVNPLHPLTSWFYCSWLFWVQYKQNNKKQIRLKPSVCPSSWEKWAPPGCFIGTELLNRLIMQSYYRRELRKFHSVGEGLFSPPLSLSLPLLLTTWLCFTSWQCFLYFSSFTSFFCFLSVSVCSFLSLSFSPLYSLCFFPPSWFFSHPLTLFFIYLSMLISFSIFPSF